MENFLGKVNRDIEKYEKRISMEQRYRQNSRSGSDRKTSPNRQHPQTSHTSHTNQTSAPQSQSPRDNSSPRSRSPRSGRPISPARPSNRNPYGSGVYTPPRKTSLHVNKPIFNTTGAPRPPATTSSPANDENWTTPPPRHMRPSSAPVGVDHRFHHPIPPSNTPSSSRAIITQTTSQKNIANNEDSNNIPQKNIDDIYRQIGEIDAKNDKQNMFLLNELMDNFQVYDEKNHISIEELESRVKSRMHTLEQHVRSVQVQMKAMEVDVKKSLQTKFRHIDQNIKAMKQHRPEKKSSAKTYDVVDDGGVGGDGNGRAEAKLPSPRHNMENEKERTRIAVEKEREIEERIKAETMKNQQLRDEFEDDQATLRAQFALRESALKKQIEEEKRKIAEMHKKYQTDQELHDASSRKSEMEREKEIENIIQERIKAETMKTQQLRNDFENDQAALHEQFALRETTLKKQIEEEKKKTAEMHKKYQTDQELHDEKIQEIESNFQFQLKEDARKNAKRLAKLQKKFDQFIENQITVISNLEQEKENALAELAARGGGSGTGGGNGNGSGSGNGRAQLREPEESVTVEQPEVNNQLSEEELEALAIETEKNALMTIFDKTGGLTSWTDTFLWSRNEAVTAWLGVDLMHNRVTGLHLGCNGLAGSIPSDITQLPMLTELRLFGNSLGGCIPSCLGQLTKLQCLLLNQNNFTGPIPNSLSKCVLLEEVDLSENQLSGLIPDGVAITTLTSLSLQNNQLEGPLPRSLTTLRMLEHFSADQLPFEADDEETFFKVNDYINAHATEDNSVDLDAYNGNMREEQENLISALKEFGGDPSDLSWSASVTPAKWEGVSFDQQGCVRSLMLAEHSPPLELPGGNFPESIEFLSNILFLDLSNNKLGGEFPRELCSLAHLQFLYLNNNQFDGEIRPDVGKMDSLKTLNLSYNQFTGSLEPRLSELQDLEVLILSNNSLDGEISENFCKFSKLRVFDVSSNSLTGELPGLSGLPALEKLSVSCNQLHGPVPISIGELSGLRHLDISFNSEMNGSLPSVMTQLKHLTEINIQMTGGAGTGGDAAGTITEEVDNASDSMGTPPSVEVRRRTIMKKLPSLNKISM